MGQSNYLFFSKIPYNFDFNFDDLTFNNILKCICTVAIIFGGIIPYIPQYKEIYKTRNADGFSINVCFVLLFANILRIIFWFGNKFELPLLIQSIVMIITMLAMVEICVRVKNQSIETSRYFFDIEAKYFWKWTDFLSYIECLTAIAIISSLIMYALIDYYYFVQSFGLIALIAESLLGLPQLLLNFKKKSTKGVNKAMVFLWLGGDVSKTVYYIIQETPFQFFLCGTIQIFIDILILFQVYCIYPSEEDQDLERLQEDPKLEDFAA